MLPWLGTKSVGEKGKRGPSTTNLRTEENEWRLVGQEVAELKRYSSKEEDDPYNESLGLGKLQLMGGDQSSRQVTVPPRINDESDGPL